MTLIYGGISYFKKEAELTFKSKTVWSWHDRSQGIQVGYVEGMGAWVFRRIHSDDNYAVYATLDADFNVQSAVYFVEQCESGQRIETTKLWETGKPKVLRCSKSGNTLIFASNLGSPDMLSSWSDNLDGFKFKEDFSGWDWNYLMRKMTMNKLKADKASKGK
ncbi:hypothetical protein AB4254_11740 [Vibrio breoganii]